jgi:hypothetical protein
MHPRVCTWQVKTTAMWFAPALQYSPAQAPFCALSVHAGRKDVTASFGPGSTQDRVLVEALCCRLGLPVDLCCGPPVGLQPCCIYMQLGGPPVGLQPCCIYMHTQGCAKHDRAPAATQLHVSQAVCYGCTTATTKHASIAVAAAWPTLGPVMLSPLWSRTVCCLCQAQSACFRESAGLPLPLCCYLSQ